MALTHIFVLMLENRSFDHLLGFSGLTGVDAVTGKRTTIDGLSGEESNSYLGQTYGVVQPAPETMPIDPGHEFLDVLKQLSGETAVYPPGGPYPPIDNSGFVADYASSPSPDEGNAPSDYCAVMRCCAPGQLPALTALARNFAVCDHWQAAMPGPTLPNRLFACAASSGGLDHSPTNGELAQWQIDGFSFAQGTIFDRLGQGGWRIFSGNDLPLVSVLKGVNLLEVANFDGFAEAVADPGYAYRYTWIEPDYGEFWSSFAGGNSQHPLDGIAPGDALVKATYEAIRQSPHWPTSLLIVTWDEHGGFYDHAAPPAAVPPGDTAPGSAHNKYGFTFDRYGVRVPAIIVSPLIPESTIDHRLYDHSSIPATIEKAFGLAPLTARDKAANTVLPLLSLDKARDTPATLPAVASPRVALRVAPQRVPAPEGSVDHGNLPAFVHAAMRHDLALSPPAEHAAIRARVRSIHTRAEAAQYVTEVQQKIRAAKPRR
jgi:phospholipase C